MRYVCTPNLLGMGSPVLEILILFCFSLKSAKFPFRTMDYIVHGGQKIELAQKFFMQVEINEVRMRTKSLGSVLRICLMLCYT